MHQVLLIDILEKIKMNAGDLLFVDKDDVIFGHRFNTRDKYYYTKVKLKPGCYLIVEKYNYCFYEILLENEIVLIRL